jgi:hypothetical protein
MHKRRRTGPVWHGEQPHGELDIQHKPDGSVVITHQPHGDFGAEAPTPKAKSKVPAVAATVAGAAIGIPFGPVGIGVGLAIGGVVDLLRHKKAAPTSAAKAPGITFLPAQTPEQIAAGYAAKAALSPASNAHMLTISAANKAAPAPIRLVLHIPTAMAHAAPVPTPTEMAKASDAAAAKPIPEVTVLKNYFAKYGGDRVLGEENFWNTTQMRYMVQAFQDAFNKQTASVKALGLLPSTGLFGPKTSAAYTFYTHETVEPDASADDS